jgi:hypothetical protein
LATDWALFSRTHPVTLAHTDVFVPTIRQGCQIFLGPKYQNGEKYTKLPQNIPNGRKILPMTVK